MEQNKLVLKSVRIARGYGSDSPFKAEVVVTNSYNAEIALQLDEARTLDLILVVSDLLVNATETLVGDFKEGAIELFEASQPKQLETKAEFTEVEGDPLGDEILP